MKDHREQVFIPRMNFNSNICCRFFNVSCIFNSKVPWMTSIDDFRNAKKLRRQYERIWRRNKTFLNRSKLHKQTNKCNYILNKSKAKFYSHIINENSNNSNLLEKINNILHMKNDSVLPESENDKTLSETFSSFFLDKITKNTKYLSW